MESNVSGFNGFKPSFFKFFRELSDNNNRPWFTENKPRYEDDVVAPLLAFIEEMAPRLNRVSKYYLAIPKKSGGSMFRIYRDVRFSKDGRPYKEHGACQFRHQLGKDAHAPGFYVHLQPRQVFFGGGIWTPPGPELLKIRETIADSPVAWGKIINDKKLKDMFGGIRGNGLKTAPRGFDPEHKHIEDLRRKSFFLMREGTQKLAGSAAFADEVESAFMACRPLMRFISHAVNVPF